MNAIVAADRNWAIGRESSLLFPLPGDMKRFRALTSGGTVIMGRKTLDSFPGGRPLSGRRNIVITRDPGFNRDSCEVVHSPAAALTLAGKDPYVWLIGGGSIYAALLACCHRVCVTRVDAAVPDADVFFPDLDALPEWTVERTSEPITENGFTYRFVDYIRRTPVRPPDVFSPC